MRDRDLPPRRFDDQQPAVSSRLRSAWHSGVQDPANGTGLAALAAAAAAKAAADREACGADSPGKGTSSACTPPRRRSTTPGKARLIADESICSSISAPRSVLQEINSQARFEALHKDGERRRLRKEQYEREKLQREEDEARKFLQPPPRRRASEGWANEQLAAHARRERAREAKRQKENMSRSEQALRECTFAPRLVSREAPKERQLSKAQQHLEGLAEQQQSCVARLEELRSEEFSLSFGVDEQDSFTPGLQSETQSAVAQRRCRIGCLQVLHELARLESEALSTASRASQLGRRSQPSTPPPLQAAAGLLAELCPAFDLEVLAKVRGETAPVETALPGTKFEADGFGERPLPAAPSEFVAVDVGPSFSPDKGQIAPLETAVPATKFEADGIGEMSGALLQVPLPAAQDLAAIGATLDEARHWMWQ